MNSFIRRQTLHEELSAEIRQMILSSELTPGDKVFEPELCDRFQVSRTPLREALKVLAAEGLVQLLPNRGARIALITREEAMQIFPIIGGLEALAGELACQELEDREIARIQELHDVMVGHYRRQEDEAYITLNRTIHEAFIDGARNPRLADVYRREHGRLSTLRYFAPKSPSQWGEAVEEHEQMMSALHRRDGRRFAEIARDHMRHKADVVLQTIDALQSRSRAA